MLILTIRTDKPEAELGLFEGDKELDYQVWYAHRELAETIHLKIQALLDSHGKQLKDVQGVAVFKGPGSFTGLRIGAAVGNALADSLAIPVVGSQGEGWRQAALAALESGRNDKVVVPEYGANANITPQKK